MKTRILVASHKAYKIPQDELYIPLQVGADLNSPIEGFVLDNTGDNISSKNKTFCELTGVYWAWKNINCEVLKEADYIGFCHYRRYFCEPKSKPILGLNTAEKLCEKTDIILPKKRNYFIETNYSQYVHAHHEIDLIETRKILMEQQYIQSPDYVSAFDNVMKKTTGHRFNMFIMHKDVFNAYCIWLFGVLFELENRLDISQYSSYDARVFGFVAERLLDVWIEANNKQYIELPFVFTEKENWIKKGGAFLMRKFFAKKN